MNLLPNKALHLTASSVRCAPASGSRRALSLCPEWRLVHIHVRCSNGEAKFWLVPVALARNRGVPPHDLREIERLIFENRQTLIDKYHEYHNL
jgi:hypothetical protein